jgi:uncharacterized repeat protein (TIGR02543 family)
MRTRGVTELWGVMAVVAVTAMLVTVSGCSSSGAGGGTGGGSGAGSDLEIYSVIYDANGASGGVAPDAQTKSAGVDLTLSGNTGNLERTGYTYAGWNTASDGTGTDYAEGATYAADANLELHAKWTANQYTVSFNRHGGAGGSTSVTATYGSPMPAATAPTKEGAAFGGYYAGPDATGSQYYTAEMESVENWDVPGDTELVAYWVFVGGPGPAGGLVFYDKGAHTDGWRYLEAWTADEDNSYKWKTSLTLTTGTSTSIGSGYANTYSALTGAEHPAAEVVRNATHGGFSDWFLPSRDELEQMYENLWKVERERVGDFENAWYWSSSEDTRTRDDAAWAKAFGTGFQNGASKFWEIRVRAARAF